MIARARRPTRPDLRLLGGGALLGSLLCAGAQGAPPVPSADLGQIHCTATAVAPIVRGEGTGERAGDILISCHNAGPATRVEPRGFIEADVELRLGDAAANRVDAEPGSDAMGAVLIVNGNDCLQPVSGSALESCATATNTVQGPMRGRWGALGSGTVRWEQVQIPIPGAAIADGAQVPDPVADCTERFGIPSGCHPLTTTLLLTNIRVNAAELAAAGEAAVPIEAAVTFRAADATVHLEHGVLPIARAAPGLRAAARIAEPDRLCSHGEATAGVTVTEGFADAFRAADRLLFGPDGAGRSTPAAAGAGTRIRLQLSDLPAQIAVAVPARLACSSTGGMVLGLVEGADIAGFGGAPTSQTAGERRISTPGGAVTTALYEVLSENPLVIEECVIPVRMTRSSGSAAPERGTEVTVAVTLAPLTHLAARQDRRAEPQFADPRRGQSTTVRLSDCGTVLFFPFVTTRSSYDTAIVIANTSADPLGSRHQSGRCTLQYRGSGVGGQTNPDRMTTIELAAGENLAFTLSNGNAQQGVRAVTDFQGHLVAECAFQHAQGFAFVTEQIGGASILAQGYLAEVVHLSQDAGATPDGP